MQLRLQSIVRARALLANAAKVQAPKIRQQGSKQSSKILPGRKRCKQSAAPKKMPPLTRAAPRGGKTKRQQARRGRTDSSRHAPPSQWETLAQAQPALRPLQGTGRHPNRLGKIARMKSSDHSSAQEQKLAPNDSDSRAREERQRSRLARQALPPKCRVLRLRRLCALQPNSWAQWTQ